MANFLLIVCKDESGSRASSRNTIKTCLDAIINRLKLRKPEDWLESAEIHTGTSFFLLRLPYDADKLYKFGDHKASKINKLIEEIKVQNHIEDVYISNSLKHITWLVSNNDSTLSGKELYRALAVKVLEEICKSKGISIRDLDITIVHGDEDAFLVELAEMLSDYVKFVTIVSNSKEKIEESLNGIYSEKGLSIGITKDYKRGLKNADVIINLGDLREFIVNSRINTKAAILNFGNLDKRRVFSENTIINGIEIEFPQMFRNTILKEVGGHFTEIQLAEMIIRHGNMENMTSGSQFQQEYSFIKNAAYRFEEVGFKIKSLSTS